MNQKPPSVWDITRPPRLVGREGKKFGEPPTGIVWHIEPIPERRIRQYRERTGHAAVSLYDVYRWMVQTGRAHAPHIAISSDSRRVLEMVPINTIAHHSGSAARWRYNRWYKAPSWWLERWGHLGKHPREAFPNVWRGGSVNKNTLSIAFVVPMGYREPLTWYHWDGAERALNHCFNAYPSLTDGCNGWLTHSDVDPIRRANSKGPWDTHPTQVTPEELKEKFKNVVSSRSP